MVRQMPTTDIEDAMGEAQTKGRSRTTLNSTPMIAQPDNNGPLWFTKRDRYLMQGLLL
jgi:hypothetical protein